MSRRPTLKLPAKPRAEKTRSATVRPTAPKPKRAAAPAKPARTRAGATETSQPARTARTPQRSEPVAKPQAARRREAEQTERPRRPRPAAAEPDKSRDEKREEQRPPRPARKPAEARPERSASPRTARARSEAERSGAAKKPCRGSATLADRGGARAPAGAKPRFEARPATPAASAARSASGAGPRSASGAEPRTELPRLSKRMSELGLCSRREADEWIENGWVRVDGAVAELGLRVHPNAKIEIDEAARRHQSETVTILLHKPIGYVSGQAEEGYEPAAVLIRPENRWDADQAPLAFKRGHLRGLAPAGRLDIDSTGLLVFTQDGRIAKRLVGDDSKVEKEYLVRVEGELIENGLALLNHGLELDGKKLKPAHVSWQNEHQLRFVLREGKKRQIRRMCELVGLKVTGLKRIRIGSVVLSKLPPGKWRYLRPDEKF